MLWKEFKEIVEEAGVTDDMGISTIFVQKCFCSDIKLLITISPTYKHKEIDVWVK